METQLINQKERPLKKDGTVRSVTVEGVTLAYEEYGHGEPVVFIHGISASSYSWRTVAQALSDSYRCISIDLMGFGRSDKPRDESYSLKRQAELVLKAIEKIGIERFVLAGHSLGGGVSLAIMRELGENQERVRGLILVDTACYLQNIPIFIGVLKVPILPLLVMKIVPEKWGFMFSGGAMYKGGMKSEAIEEYTRCLKTPGAHESLIATAKELIPPDLDEFMGSYSKISVPTQIIWGRYDKVIPIDLGRRLRDAVRTPYFHIVENCGHCPQEESPAEIAQLIRKFIDGLEMSS